MYIFEDFLGARRAGVLTAMTIDMTFERQEELIREEQRIAELEAQLATKG